MADDSLNDDWMNGGAGDGASEVGDRLRTERGERFFVVGVGASAGGVEAVSALLRRLGAFENMAVVVIQHLLPDQPSMLVEILERVTPCKVVTATEGLAMRPGHVYVAPPGAGLALLGGALHLVDAGEQAPRLPIDYFFRSLADDQDRMAIGVVLSGTGTDGTFGLRAIKYAGGITFAQEPSSAKFDGMPRSARESGAADYCLAPDAIAEELSNLGAHPYLAMGRPKHRPQAQEHLSRLFVMLRAVFGNDFSGYKPSTIERRIERRMALNKIERLEDYVKFVQSNQQELRTLYKDVLIGVTSFFRDREPFEVLRTQVLPAILQQKPPGSSIRAWVPACSTGEEAYSIAIVLLEALEERAHDYRLQVFATDLDEEAVEIARRGVYPANIALDVSADRLQRFFVQKDDGSYQISRRARDLVVFSVQNIVRDAPFSRLDLVSCRNLLIYLQPALQKRVLRVLHYSLNPGGYLMLGTSETVGDSPELFASVDRTNKIYVSKLLAAASLVDFRLGGQGPEPARGVGGAMTQRPVANVAAIADRKILELFGPPGVVINEQLEILHFRGRTGPYLEPAPGAASLNILRLARSDIHAELRRALQLATAENKPVSVDCRLSDEGKTRNVRLQVVPISEPETKARCLLVLFHESPEPDEPLQPMAPADLGSPLQARCISAREAEGRAGRNPHGTDGIRASHSASRVFFPARRAGGVHLGRASSGGARGRAAGGRIGTCAGHVRERVVGGARAALPGAWRRRRVRRHDAAPDLRVRAAPVRRRADPRVRRRRPRDAGSRGRHGGAADRRERGGA